MRWIDLEIGDYFTTEACRWIWQKVSFDQYLTFDGDTLTLWQEARNFERMRHEEDQPAWFRYIPIVIPACFVDDL